jgi:hypothetical protein
MPLSITKKIGDSTMTARFPRLLLVAFAAVTTLMLVLPATSESGGNKNPDKKFKPGEDHLKNKARWQWTLQEGGKEVDKGTFMGYTDGKICHGEDQKQIGNWKKTKTVGTLAVTFNYPRLEGSWTFVMTRGVPPTYDCKDKGGTKRLHVEILND